MNKKEQQVFDKYKGQWPDALNLFGYIQYFSAGDPSKTNKYLDWCIKIITEDPFAEIVQISRLVKDFHKYQNGITGDHVLKCFDKYKIPLNSVNSLIFDKPRDINAYAEYKSLKGVVDVYIEEKDSIKDKKILAKDYDIILDDENYKIVVPLSHEASKTLGYGTKWCTAMLECNEHFINYTNEGILYYVIDKIRTDPEHPLHKFAYYRRFDRKASGDTFNAPDVCLGDITYLLPENIVKLINNYHNNQISLDCLISIINEKTNKLINKKEKIKILTKVSNKSDIINKIPFIIQYNKLTKRNVIILDIVGFKGWQYALKFVKDGESFGFEASLKHVTRNYSVKVVDKFDNIKISRAARLLNKTKDEHKVSDTIDFIHDTIHEKLNKHHWWSLSVIIFKTIENEFTRLSKENWSVNLFEDNTIDEFRKNHKLNFSLSNETKRTHYCGKNFTGEIRLRINNKQKFEVEISLAGDDTGRYIWDTVVERLEVNFSEDNIIAYINRSITRFKNHIKTTKKESSLIPLVDDIFTYYNDKDSGVYDMYGMLHQTTEQKTLEIVTKYLNNIGYGH